MKNYQGQFKSPALSSILLSSLLALGWLGAGVIQAQTYVLGRTNLLVGPAAGTNSVVLGVMPQTASWTAAANDLWLHVPASNQSGTGSTNVFFTCDANTGPIRTGTLIIAGQMLNVVQAGAGFIELRSSVQIAHEYTTVGNLAPDAAGDLYIAIPGKPVQNISEWTPSNNATTYLDIAGLSQPNGVGVDNNGNLYIADTGSNSIRELTTEGNLVTLPISNIGSPQGVAVDRSGNVFIADYGNGALKGWNPTNGTISTLASGLSGPSDVAVDAAGNAYFTQGIPSPSTGELDEWIAANGKVITLFSNYDGNAVGVGVDGSGNVYVGSTGDISFPQTLVLEWSPITGTVKTYFGPSFGLII
ncbi:MAG TPA: hypothetical protein VGN61_01075, partial [Verrucomicrobiae bacterium]